MKITVATTWNQQCGIAEYSRSLVTSFLKLGHEVKILGSEVFPLLKEDEPFVTRLGKPDKCDVLHIQYSSFIFTQEYVNRILILAKSNGTKCFVTFHDQFLPGFDYSQLDGIIAHRDDVFKYFPDTPKHIIPSGIPTVPVKIMSYGLGRNRNDDIKRVCDELGYDFFISDYRNWKTQEELLEFIKGGDGVILWYPDNKAAGSSSCSRFAIGARRPLFVNNCTWFQEIAGCTDVIFFRDYQDLRNKLQERFYNPAIDYQNWDKIAEMHLEIYRGLRS